jgi:hypothetical protein
MAPTDADDDSDSATFLQAEGPAPRSATSRRGQACNGADADWSQGEV